MSLNPARIALVLLAGATAISAQSYDPERGHPFTLLAAPKDGVAYYELRQRVLALAVQGKAAESEAMAEQLVREYPRDGENWNLLGRVKRRLNKFAAAVAAFDTAGMLLGRESAVRPFDLIIAGTQLAAGNKPAALEAIRRSIFDDRLIVRGSLIDDAPLAALRTDSAFLALIGRRDTTGVSRAEGWRRDVDFLVEEMKRVNPDYRDRPLPPEFVRRYQDLKKNVPTLSHEQFVVGVNRMLAALHQGHTSFVGGGPVHHLPVQFYVFPEGIFIVRAADQYKDLIGARVVSFGRTPAEEALRLMNLMQSVDGDMEYLSQGAFLLRNAEYLKGSGIDIDVESVELSVEMRDGKRRTLRLGGPDIQGWGPLPVPAGVDAPLFLRNVEAAHWEQPMPEHDALYVQVNRMRNDSTQTLPAFGTRIWSVLEQRKPKNLIVDLRHNGGGSTSLYPELLRTIIAFTRGEGRKLYVLIGRGTYSATANFITDLERLANPTFVGEASSECCNLHGDALSVEVPYSKHSGYVSGVRWNLGRDVFDGRREINPDVPVQLTAPAYFAGEDPALAAVFRLIHAPVNGTR
jgi:tetratricopeptide (TPR) repeat protein